MFIVFLSWFVIVFHLLSYFVIVWMYISCFVVVVVIIITIFLSYLFHKRPISSCFLHPHLCWSNHILGFRHDW